MTTDFSVTGHRFLLLGGMHVSAWYDNLADSLMSLLRCKFLIYDFLRLLAFSSC